MLEHAKKWIVEHKALAAGGAIALVVLLWLWLRSGSAPAAGDGGAVAAYYGAQGMAAQGAAATQVSADQLAAASNQVNAQRDVALAQTLVPYQAYLESVTQQLNARAYTDWLHEANTAGASVNQGIALPGSGIYSAATSAAGTTTLYQGIVGNSSSLVLYNPQTGEISHNNEVPGTWSYIDASAPSHLVNWSGIAGDPITPYTPPPSTPFVAPFTTPQLSTH